MSVLGTTRLEAVLRAGENHRYEVETEAGVKDAWSKVSQGASKAAQSAKGAVKSAKGAVPKRGKTDPSASVPLVNSGQTVKQPSQPATKNWPAMNRARNSRRGNQKQSTQPSVVNEVIPQKPTLVRQERSKELTVAPMPDNTNVLAQKKTDVENAISQLSQKIVDCIKTEVEAQKGKFKEYASEAERAIDAYKAKIKELEGNAENTTQILDEEEQKHEAYADAIKKLVDEFCQKTKQAAEDHYPKGKK